MDDLKFEKQKQKFQTQIILFKGKEDTRYLVLEIFQIFKWGKRIFRKCKSRQTIFILKTTINKITSSLFLLVYDWLAVDLSLRERFRKLKQKSSDKKTNNTNY